MLTSLMPCKQTHPDRACSRPGAAGKNAGNGVFIRLCKIRVLRIAAVSALKRPSRAASPNGTHRFGSQFAIARLGCMVIEPGSYGTKHPCERSTCAPHFKPTCTEAGGGALARGCGDRLPSRWLECRSTRVIRCMAAEQIELLGGFLRVPRRLFTG